MTSVRRDDALAELPTAHAVALRLADGGADLNTIATALGVPVEAVKGLLDVAEEKLASILGDDHIDLRLEQDVPKQ